MRAIWTGAISFGLVNIPVRLYSAINSGASLDLDMLYKKDLSRIRYAKIAVSTGKEIEYKDVVKGFEYEKGHYVVIDEKDFAKASPEKTKTVEIVDFVKESEIDSMFFDKPYFLEPDKGAAKPYALLRDALKKSKKVGIAKFVIRNRERIGALKVSGDVIMLNQMRYNNELRSSEGIEIPGTAKVSPKEVEMALKLIDQLTTKFKPAQYKDTYINELKKIIDAKAHGKTIKAPKAKKAPGKVKDLMSVLQESLKHSKKHAA